ncbi:cytochrome b561 and DOMON domain-containing protein At5g47530-like [Cynara cardunculus var. scolymus]|uniref:cytochrome b561 and DOMON domain-containing protein At5g47530-like n=1 Tax=Cynara cardunculus var. scolymus TaxID=59895 RepID=UPI000D624545|nr:cytochrome b561 and DOMON domain-containing protein At5g47530-like [Cynara cardunculus var. scolymus]
MGFGLKNIFLLFTIMAAMFSSSSSAQSCSNYAFKTNNKVFSACNDLPVLNSFLHYTYNPSSKTLKIAYRRTNIDPSKWVAWAINPTSKGMVGSQALVAFRQSNGKMRVYTSPVTGYSTQLPEGDLSFPVSELSAAYSDKEMIIFATLGLQNVSIINLNQVWQDGGVSGNAPMAHVTSGDNVKSMGTLNVLSGRSGSAGGSSSKTKKRNIHGILNAISWGIMMPLGAIMARYIRVFQSADPAWFYLHVTCQTLAYIIGVAGWATGIRLGTQSPGIQFTSHRLIGIILFCVATLQVIALLVRPKKDHKFRIYWNIYHHSLGYGIIILGIINIFKGFDILNPEKKWKRGYTGIIIVVAAIAAVLEAYTWVVVLRRNKAANKEKMIMRNGSNGNHNRYGGVTNGN